MTELDRILRFKEDHIRSQADDVQEHLFGFAVRNLRYAASHHHNKVVITGPADAPEILTLADHARAVVTEAIHRAGGLTLFLEADETDWPKDFYGRLGFTPVGRTHHFRRMS